MASAVYRGANSPDYSIDIEEQDSGYIISHPTYGGTDYPPNINSTLILTGLQDMFLIIDLLKFNVGGGGCPGDHLKISTVDKLCGDITQPYKLIVQPINNSVTFNFYTTRSNHKEGFLLFYKGE